MTFAVVLNSLTKYFGERRGISNISLDVEPGQVFGFLGPNGSGKSTTIRLMLGLYRPTRGGCRVLGLDPTRDGTELLARVGYLPGELNLFPRMTGREILDRFAHVRELHDLRPQGELVERFGVELDRPVRMLSKGNRQKIGLVLAFMHHPELLVLDEPTSGLDPLLQDEFATLLGETVAEGRTVFLSSHDLDEVQRVVNQLAIIKDGFLVISDSVEGLRRTVPKTIELEFAHAVDPAPLAAQPGVDIRSHTGRRMVLTVTGALAPVLAQAARMQATDIVSRPADLDELFLSFYAGQTAQTSPTRGTHAH